MARAIAYARAVPLCPAGHTRHIFCLMRDMRYDAKPDVSFFGANLPNRTHNRPHAAKFRKRPLLYKYPRNGFARISVVLDKRTCGSWRIE